MTAGARLSEAESARRLPVWSALSELFLDTEQDSADHARIRARLTASGYAGATLHHILLHEVTPVFGPNLMLVAGEWAGWSDDAVRDAMTAYLARDRGQRRGWLIRWLLRRHLREQWPLVVPG